MKKRELAPAQAFLDLCLPLGALVVVPEPAECLNEKGRDQEEQHQNNEAHVGFFLVESHNGKYVQHYVEQQEQQTQTNEEEVHGGVLEHTHCVCQTKVLISPSTGCF